MPSSKEQNPVLARADALLASIRNQQQQYDRINEQWNAAIKELERQYADTAQAHAQKIRDLEKDLRKHVKKHKDEIFAAGADRAELASGALIYSVSDRVKRAKAVTVDRLKELGYTDGIKIEEKVWWEALESWTDERLIAAGTERTRKEQIEYEIHDGGKNVTRD